MNKKIFIIGEPAAGKSTFLAALWHSVTQGIKDTEYQLDHMGMNVSYLYGLEGKWINGEKLDRTKITQEISEQTVFLKNENEKLEIEFPDLSGETFQNIYDYRNLSPDLYEKINRADAILYIINVDNIHTFEYIADIKKWIRKSSSNKEQNEEPKIQERKPSQDDPTAIQVLDLLQIISKIKRKKIKLGIVFSAWDLVEDMKNVNPRSYLKDNLFILWQYLEANKNLFDTKIWGVSAQGGKIEELEEKGLLSKEAIERIIVIDEKQELSNDITKIIAELSRDKNE